MKIGQLFKSLYTFKSGEIPKLSIKDIPQVLSGFEPPYIILSGLGKDICQYNNDFIQLFEFPDNYKLNSLSGTQIMMRYLAENSENKDSLMNGVAHQWEGKATFFNYSKKTIHVQISSYHFEDKENEEVKQLLVFKDITELVETKRAICELQAKMEGAVKSKDRFLSSMSHELRTPLNGIIGTSNLLLTEPGISTSIKEHLQILVYSSEHMLGIINDILDFSKIDAGKMEFRNTEVCMETWLQNITKSFQHRFDEKGIQLKLVMDSQLADCTVKTDEVKLSQVLNNLLSNSLKFTHEGEVVLGVSAIDETSDTVQVYFEVSDTGIGIEEEKLAEIFEGFKQVYSSEFSRRYGGTGLGLTISEKLVNIFGGKLEVKSEYGKGSSFFFTIPMNKTTAIVGQLAPPAKEIAVGDTRGLKVLVAEDNEINASILVNFLRKWGIQIKEAQTGVHAVELCKFHQFDMILMDLEMPDMDGYTALTRIREKDKQTPILAFTATLLENMSSLITEKGFDDYVLKPFKPSELKNKILKYAPFRKINYA